MSATALTPSGSYHATPHSRPGLPVKQGLYDPRYEHDACGVGFVVDVKGRKSRSIVAQGLQVLLNLAHRGACGCEPNTGDGAGILMQMPDKFMRKAAAVSGIELPPPGEYAVGMVFLPQREDYRFRCQERFENIVRAEGQTVLGWRTVPTANQELGHTARLGEPAVRQVFIGRNPERLKGNDDLAFERIVNVPKRGLGTATMQTLHAAARSTGISLASAALELIQTDELRPQARTALGHLMASFERWRGMLDTIPHTEVSELMLDESGYTAMWQAD